MLLLHLVCVFCFFFNDTATTEIYTLSLHDALPICNTELRLVDRTKMFQLCNNYSLDRKSTRLNSSHLGISYAVFCLKKKIKYRSNTRIESSGGSIVNLGVPSGCR